MGRPTCGRKRGEVIRGPGGKPNRTLGIDIWEAIYLMGGKTRIGRDLCPGKKERTCLHQRGCHSLLGKEI
eukprot:8241193-Prorocentrum_lima.AAC.1